MTAGGWPGGPARAQQSDDRLDVVQESPERAVRFDRPRCGGVAVRIISFPGMRGARWGLQVWLDTGTARTAKQETRMIKRVTGLLTLTMFSMALMAAPAAIPAFAAGGGDSPAASPSSSGGQAPAKTTKKKKSKQSGVEDPAFLQGYRTAYATIYDRHDYAGAIEQLKALGHDDNAGVANLIGYSYRKLGDYRLSQAWYERALKTDPNHVLTWQYYGLWQIEQGNRDQAQYHLAKIASICGTGCDEYRSLAAALEKPPGTGLVY
jgi:tetratricopeptide (TPR) repeat protein